MDEDNAVHELQHLLVLNLELHDHALTDELLVKNLATLRKWQMERLSQTHRDLLENPETHDAAHFFFSDLYGENDFSARDRDIARVFKHMVKLLPEATIDVVILAIKLQYTTQVLDHDMARLMESAYIDHDVWVDLYRQVKHYDKRAEQIKLMRSLGEGLMPVIQNSGLLQLLKLLHWPAAIAGLSELQSFLERGFSAFSNLDDPQAFIDKVVDREQQLAQQLQSHCDVVNFHMRD